MKNRQKIISKVQCSGVRWTEFLLSGLQNTEIPFLRKKKRGKTKKEETRIRQTVCLLFSISSKSWIFKIWLLLVEMIVLEGDDLKKCVLDLAEFVLDTGLVDDFASSEKKWCWLASKSLSSMGDKGTLVNLYRPLASIDSPFGGDPLKKERR